VNASIQYLQSGSVAVPKGKVLRVGPALRKARLSMVHFGFATTRDIAHRKLSYSVWIVHWISEYQRQSRH